jgi:glycosyltransferase involved in cell wall biosynthesis
LVSFPIAYIAGVFPARSETFVYREVRALRALGWPVTVASLNDPPERGLAELSDLEAGTVYVYGSGRGATIAAMFAEGFTHPIRTIGTKLLALRDALSPGEKMSGGARFKLIAQALAGIGLARRLRHAGVQHVHCHFAHAPTTVGMYAARQLGVPFSFTGHANDIFQRRALLRRKLERAAFVACISEWHREFYGDIFAQGADRYRVVRCGVDVNAWTPKPDAGREISAHDMLRVLTVCRLVEKKGVDTLIRGLAQFCKTTGRRFRLTIAGDGPERARLERLAEETGCSDSITWLGAVGNEQVRVRLAECDVFALPCKQDHNGDRDGIPVVLMEAMACGAPVLSGDLPAIRELVSDDETGILVDGNRPEQVSSALVRLADAPALRSRLAQSARQRVEREFSLAGNVARLTHLIELKHSGKKAYADGAAVSATP